MTFDPNIPNSGQSPSMFPAQSIANFTRLQTIINSEHVFNDTAAADDGIHRQTTFVNRANPSSVPAGGNSVVYGKAASDAVNELWFYDAIGAKQLNWRQASGTHVITTSMTNIITIPANAYGYIFLTATSVIQAGTFASTASLAEAYSFAQVFTVSGSSSEIIMLGNGANASGLNIRAKAHISLVGTWNYYAFWRLK